MLLFACVEWTNAVAGIYDHINDDGVLVIDSGGIVTLDTGTLGYLKAYLDADEERELAAILMNDGTIRVLDADSDGLFAVDVTIGTGGGTFDVNAGVVFKIGEMTGRTAENETGDVQVIGGGTLQVGKVDVDGNFSVELGIVEFLDTARIGGHFTLVSGTVEFHDTARIARSLTVEDGTLEFHDSARIDGNVIVGKREEVGENGASVGQPQEGTIRFYETAHISEHFTLVGGEVEFRGIAMLAKNLTIESGHVEFFYLDPARYDHASNVRHQIGGILELQDGTIDFRSDAIIGTLRSAAGTTISGLRGDAENSRSDLSIVSGGEIRGILEDVGILVVGDRNTVGTLAFFNTGIAVPGQTHSQSHSMERIVITERAILDLKDGASIQLLNSEDSSQKFDDITILGTLRVSSAALGIYRGDLSTLDLEDTFITVAGTTNAASNVIGGIVEIYRSTDSPEANNLIANTLHTQVIGVGQINVAYGVTFESGNIKWGAGQGQAAGIPGATVVVSGGGHYRVGNVDLGTDQRTSSLWVLNERNSQNELTGRGITLEFLENVTAREFFSENNTQIIAHGNAAFETAYIAGSYEGVRDAHGNPISNLTISQGGWIAGNVSDVKELTLGGTLLLVVDNTETPTISVETLTFIPNATTRIRTLPGITSGYFGRVIEITGNDTDRDQLLDILHASQTALYRPEWSPNEGNSPFTLDLNLRIFTVDEYIRDEWGRSGRNVHNIGTLIEGISRQSNALGLRDYTFRSYLESISDAELQSAIRNALAGELAGNAFRIAMHQPAHSVFRHLDTVAPLRSPAWGRTWGGRTRGQVREGFHMWFNPYGQAERGSGETDTFDGYRLSRFGFNLGGDIEIHNRAVFGAFFGYAAPSVKSDLGRISANDYRAGLYLRIPSAWDVIVNMMIGFGTQDYAYRNSFARSNFRGNSLFGSVELSRPITLIYKRVNSMSLPPAPPAFQLIPLIALDFQTANMDSFIVRDPVLGGVLVEPEDLSSAMLRIGLLGDMGRTFRTRVQYMRQIAGDDVVLSQTSVWGNPASTQVRGTQWGKDWLNVGLGGDLTLGRFRHWRLFADYDFTMSRRTTSHIGSLNTVLTW